MDKMLRRGILLHKRVYPVGYSLRSKSVSPESELSGGDVDPEKKYLGQPTHATHPHLIGENEVLPLVTAVELGARREKLAGLVSESATHNQKEGKKHLIVIPSATKKYMSDKIPYVFRQNSDFLYFSGCQEPDTCLVMTSAPSGHESVLFVRDPDSHLELWDGPRTGPDDAVRFFGVDRALPMSELGAFLRAHAKPSEPSLLWCDLSSAQMHPRVEKAIKDYVRNSPNKVWDSPEQFIHRVRMIKSPAEVELMRRSCEIASKAIMNCIKISKPGISEHELFARVDYDCRVLGANFLAYPPVIAGGNRATTIHYVNNNQVVNDGEMVLMDAGCEYYGYCSDITRTWPVGGGGFTEAQRELYEAISSVQQDLILMLRQRPSLDQLLGAMYDVLGKRLQEIGLIDRAEGRVVAFRRAQQLCPHHVSHYLGMDVHDTPTVSRTVGLQPGMVVTVEPGVYIKHDAPVPKEFRGLGIRIEDDVLITEGEPLVLTSGCPKNVSDIENISAYINNRL